MSGSYWTVPKASVGHHRAPLLEKTDAGWSDAGPIFATHTYVNGLVCGRYPGREALLTDLAEFVENHRPHGRLTVDATEPAWNGYLLTVACSCGVTFEGSSIFAKTGPYSLAADEPADLGFEMSWLIVQGRALDQDL
jgi:hypothetical protein